MTEEEKLRELLTFASNSAAEIFALAKKVLPMYHAVTASGETLLIELKIRDKNAAVEKARKFFEQRDVVRYVFFDEAWGLDSALAGVTDADLAHATRLGLSQFKHPARRELVLFSAEDRDRQIFGSRVISRPADAPPQLGPLVMEKTGMTHGRMVGLLRPRGTLQ
jgi:hypothetical protein